MKNQAQEILLKLLKENKVVDIGLFQKTANMKHINNLVNLVNRLRGRGYVIEEITNRSDSNRAYELVAQDAS